MNKKAIAILGAIFLLIVGTLGFLIYTKYGNKTETPSTAQNPPSEGQGPVENGPIDSPPAAAETPNFVKLIEDSVISPAIFFNGKGVTYFDMQGQLHQAKFDETSDKPVVIEKEALSIESRANISKILWPRKGDNFIAEITSGATKTWSFFDSVARSYKDLPAQVAALDWMPDGDKILFVWVDNGKATLNIGDPDTNNYQEIAELWETDNRISISPDGKSILFYQTANSGAVNAINMTTPDGKVWKALVKEGFNFGVSWSPDNHKFLFGKLDKVTRKYQLWYYDFTSGEIKNLGLFTTPEKTVWAKDSQTVYVAVPDSGNAGEDALTVDSFYKLDTVTLEKQSYVSGSVPVDGRELFLNNEETFLFFKNAQDGGLYYLDLAK